VIILGKYDKRSSLLAGKPN